MKNSNKYVAMILAVGLIDIIIPVPIVGLVLIYAILQRPPWFMRIVADIHSNDE